MQHFSTGAPCTAFIRTPHVPPTPLPLSALESCVRPAWQQKTHVNTKPLLQVRACCVRLRPVDKVGLEHRHTLRCRRLHRRERACLQKRARGFGTSAVHACPASHALHAAVQRQTRSHPTAACQPFHTSTRPSRG
eukprot:364362-Chlamydomonas_euryale.AAC.1